MTPEKIACALFILIWGIIVFIPYDITLTIEAVSSNGCPVKHLTVYTTSQNDRAAHAKEIAWAMDENMHHEHYNNTAAREYVRINCPDVYEAYTCFTPGAYKADIFRVCALYTTGGIYIDDDRIPVIPFRSMFPCVGLAAGHGKPYSIVPPFPSRMRIEFILAYAGRTQHPLLECAMDSIKFHHKMKYYGIVATDPTGPSMLYDCFVYNRDDVAIMWHAGGSIPEHDIAYLRNSNIFKGTLVVGDRIKRDKTRTQHYTTLWKNNNIYCT